MHNRNIQLPATELFKVKNGLSPAFMNEIFVENAQYVRVRIRDLEIWRALFSCCLCFEIRLFTLSLTDSGLMKLYIRYADDILLLTKEGDIDNIVNRFKIFDDNLKFSF